MKTRNALEILKHRRDKNETLQQAYEEEKLNFKIANLIRQARETAHLSQAQLAELIGTHQSVISRLEDADYEGHSLSILQRIAHALHRRLEIGMPQGESHGASI